MTINANGDMLENAEKQSQIRQLTFHDSVACPRCNKQFCDRIKRGALVKVFLPWMPLKRYFCSSCFNRFYKKDKPVN